LIVQASFILVNSKGEKMLNTSAESHMSDNFKSFRDSNVSAISKAGIDIDFLISEIENDQNSLIKKIEIIDKSIEELRSIYFSFHSMAGSETLIRLRTVMQHYRSDSEKNKIRIAASHYLIKKLQSYMENKEFRNFEPFRTGGEFIHEIKTEKLQCEKIEPQGKFKWITFSRNNSWFISRFRSLEIVEVKKFLSADAVKTKITLEITNGEKIEALDLMRGPRFPSIPGIGIRLTPEGEFYAADMKGKEIYASEDFISPMITELDKSANPLYTGRVRLFGLNHLVLFQKQ